jgi:small-conductance mechanosensitive channel
MDDGEGILIPNGEIYSNALIVRQSGSARRVKLQISIDYEAKVSRAKDIILSVLEGLEEVVAEPSPGVYVTKLSSEGITLSVYFWVDTEKYSPLKAFDNAASGINRELREAKITLYPPSTVILQNGQEDIADSESNEKDAF